MQAAIAFECRRQIELLEAGGEVVQETRLFDTERGVTRVMRSKEEAHDYRYFPDPDLPPLVLDEAMIERIRAELPELPDAKRARYVAALGLSNDDAGVLVAEQETAAFFEAVAAGREAKTVANWVMGDFFAQLNRAGLEVAESPVSAAQLGALLDLVAAGTISGRIAKQVFETMFKSGEDAAHIVARDGLRQVSDTGAIEAMIDQVIADNPDRAAEVRGGKDKLVGWFVGQVMKASGGKANPQLVNQMLKDKLTSS